jgi:hypothetical protein
VRNGVVRLTSGNSSLAAASPSAITGASSAGIQHFTVVSAASEHVRRFGRAAEPDGVMFSATRA